MEDPDLREVPIVIPEANKRKKRGQIEIVQQAEKIDAAYQKYAQLDFLCFARGLNIASQTGCRVFENCMAPFQRKFFDDIAPSLQAIRAGDPPPISRWWVERTKKASQDADLALIMLWLIAFPTRPLFMQVGAANREQAGIVKDRITHLLYWNPWLNEHVEMVLGEVRSKKKLPTGSAMAHMNILSSDIAGAHGGTPDVMIINELSHITRWEFAENMMDNADGVAQGLAIIATNAGHKGSKAEGWRNNAIKSDRWCVHVLAEPAPWHSKATIKDAEDRNPFSRYLRLWWGKWSSGKGDALNDADVDRCFTLQDSVDDPRDGMIYIGGLDLGISHDHSGFAILEVDCNNQRINVVWIKGWEPLKNTGEVDLIDVENVCRAMSQHYRISALLYDPHQAKLMAQRLTRFGVPMREMTFSSGANITKMATSFISVVEAGKLKCYDDPDGRLRRDFGKFNIVEKPYGFKLESVSDEYGHADVGTAVVIALPAAVDLLQGGMFTGDDVVAVVDGTPLTEKEEKHLPKEFKELMAVEDREHESYAAKHAGPGTAPFEDLF
jgi:hypothetical protein